MKFPAQDMFKEMSPGDTVENSLALGQKIRLEASKVSSNMFWAILQSGKTKAFEDS